MNDRRDNGYSKPDSSGPQSGTPAAGQPRKPRIEVLQRGAATGPGAGSTRDPGTAPIDSASAAAPGAAPAQASWTSNPPHQAGTPPARTRKGLSRSPTTLLIFLACLVIAGFLLYTYLSSESGVEASDKGTQLSSEDADLVEGPEAVSGPASTGELMETPGAAATDDGAVPEAEPAASPESEPAPQPAPQPAAQPNAPEPCP